MERMSLFGTEEFTNIEVKMFMFELQIILSFIQLSSVFAL